MTTTTQTAESVPGRDAPRWELDSIFPGGAASEEYRTFVTQVSLDLDRAQEALGSLPDSLVGAGSAAWAGWIQTFQDLEERVGLARSFVLCLVSQNVDDTRAGTLMGETIGLSARWDALETSLESFAARQDDDVWESFVTGDGVRDIRFYLDRIRRTARMKMPEQLEKLALELAVDGYHAWNQHYEKMAGDLRVSVEAGGKTETLSLGQNASRMTDPDRNVRRDSLTKMETAWESHADLAAMALNAQAGFRLALYRNRGWDSPLTEPLLLCRMEQATLDAMWDAIADRGRPITEYVDAKKRLLGIDRFCWYDQSAPAGKMQRQFSFAEAGDFIITHLGSFSDELGEFVRRGLAAHWVEAESRPGKRAGGWCSWLHIRQQPRIFMTFTPDYRSLATLAHEFGHAFHGHILQNEPCFVRHYPMTLAETASIFNELRVADAALADAADREEKLALIDQGLQSALTFFCNIRARYLFDRRFYAERGKGMVERERLSQIMADAQKEAFFGMLDENEGLHPLFWASKLHFFLTDVPFYNFPYTFGFLFAKGVYGLASAEGSAFAPRYRALLGDTGRMTTEEVAHKHLGVDLTKREFWDQAVDEALADIDVFKSLCG
ncbi:MAG TPA: M3 family oligoendopeptidase [Acidobacteriota bacterium]|nr:M3 family oligoendopeptidase [Acidobacteriota bacterium]